MSAAVANQYGKALLDVALASGSPVQPEEALAQLKAFRELFGSSPELREILRSPAVDPDKKLNVVTRLAGMAGIHPIVRNFLLVVTKKHRLGILPQILGSFQSQLDEKLGLVRPVVSSAHELSESYRAVLDKELERLTNRSVRSEYRVDPSLIGGTSIEVASRRFDGSVRGQLEGLRSWLSRRL